MNQVLRLPASRLADTHAAPAITVTGHFIREGRVGGAEHMLYNLIQGLATNQTKTNFLIGDRNFMSKRLQLLLDKAGPIRVLERGGNGNRFLAEQKACLSKALKSDAVLFPNYYLPPVVPRRLGLTAVVMHDFQYRHFPQYFSAKKRAWLRASQAWAMRNADRVIVISDFVRRDAIRWFGDAIAGKLTVVPNALCCDRFAGGLNLHRLCSKPYILSVAAHYPHKNLETLIRAFALVASRNGDVQLVLVGQDYNNLHGVMGKSKGIAPLIQSLNLMGRIHVTGYVNDAQLAQWYSHAEMFAFPSVFEGFGMPPVEALSFGLPTLVAGTTSLPETTRGLAEMVLDPYDVNEWAERMLATIDNPREHRPNPTSVASLKEFYAPARIARSYVSVMSH
jgi:glycosyltransferase involved in cell wall biosynthesis